MRGELSKREDIKRDLTMTGLAVDNEQEQATTLAASGGDVWKGADVDLVPQVADLLHGVRGAVCI